VLVRAPALLVDLLFLVAGAVEAAAPQ
jgi:hypothetical protein